jgi:hypothetical protein
LSHLNFKILQNLSNFTFTMTWFSGFRTQFLRALTVLGNSPSKGMFIDSCYAHCQTEMQESWFLSDSPLLAKTVRGCTILFSRVSNLDH